MSHRSHSSADLAQEMNLKIGDTITVNILGRNVTARITSLREIEWESLSINFTLVFSPNTLEGAPHNLLATVRFADDTPAAAQGAAARRIGQVLPSVTMINVADAIETFAGVFGRVMVAVRVAAAITLLAGALVLAGALATAQRRRMLQAVVLKCIGATRAKLLIAHLAEYGLLALVTAVIALGCWFACGMGGMPPGAGARDDVFAQRGRRCVRGLGRVGRGVRADRHVAGAGGASGADPARHVTRD